MVLTEAGATHPYHLNPKDDCFRLAPTYPYLEELKTAMEVISACIKLATVNKALETM